MISSDQGRYHSPQTWVPGWDGHGLRMEVIQLGEWGYLIQDPPVVLTACEWLLGRTEWGPVHEAGCSAPGRYKALDVRKLVRLSDPHLSPASSIPDRIRPSECCLITDSSLLCHAGFLLYTLRVALGSPGSLLLSLLTPWLLSTPLGQDTCLSFLALSPAPSRMDLRFTTLPPVRGG